MGKVRRGGYVFKTWIGDHSPRHVHVFRDEKLILKWDLENGKPLKGRASRKIRKIIASLVADGQL